jgi:hypothetical protein
VHGNSYSPRDKKVKEKLENYVRIKELQDTGSKKKSKNIYFQKFFLKPNLCNIFPLDILIFIFQLNTTHSVEFPLN